MLLTCMDKNNKIHEVINLFSKITGNKSILPKNTNPQKTYQWRYATKFVDLIKEYNIDWKTAQLIIIYAVNYIKEKEKNSLKTKGLWILTRKDLIDIAYKKALEIDNKDNKIIDNIKNSYSFSKNNNFEFGKSENGNLPNIIKWYDNKNICVQYIALSNSCNETIKKLDDIDRSLLPSNDELTMIRINYFLDKENLNKIKVIMPSDFIKLS